jgi:hypothetical protein
MFGLARCHIQLPEGTLHCEQSELTNTDTLSQLGFAHINAT